MPFIAVMPCMLYQVSDSFHLWFSSLISDDDFIQSKLLEVIPFPFLGVEHNYEEDVYGLLREGQTIVTLRGRSKCQF